jgi:hypothetical protein
MRETSPSVREKKAKSKDPIFKGRPETDENTTKPEDLPGFWNIPPCLVEIFGRL